MNYTFLKIFIKQNFFLVGLVIWLIWLKAKLFDLHSTYGVWKLASVLICKSTKKSDPQIFRYQGLYRCSGIYWAHVHVYAH